MPFERERLVSVPRGTFAVYSNGDEEGVRTVVLLLHGGGMASASWALFARAAKERLPGAAIVALDFRGHGNTAAHREDVGHARAPALPFCGCPSMPCLAHTVHY